jgi:hypothetical protein
MISSELPEILRMSHRIDDLLWWAKALRTARDGIAGEETEAKAA